MSKTWKIVLTGQGGQGLGLAGQILAEAAGLGEGINAVQNQSYGARARGGKSESSLIISGEEIIFPIVETPNLIIALSNIGYHQHRPHLEPEGTVIFDRDMVSEPDGGAGEYGLPLVSRSHELGNEQGVTIMALGAACRLTGICQAEQVRQAMSEHFRGEVLKANWTCFSAGMAMVE